jgi:hypothetical protein
MSIFTPKLQFPAKFKSECSVCNGVIHKGQTITVEGGDINPSYAHVKCVTKRNKNLLERERRRLDHENNRHKDV